MGSRVGGGGRRATACGFAVTSDHREELGYHGDYSHNLPKFYDEYIHVRPLLYDDDNAGEYEELVGLLDVPPTLVGYAGSEVPESYRGSSLRSLMHGDEWKRDSVIAEWGDPGGLNVCLREAGWKYIHRQELPN